MMLTAWTWLLAQLYLGWHQTANCDSENVISGEKRLIRHLMRGYERMGVEGRPVRNITTPVQVTFGLGLIQMHLDEKEKVLTMSMWTRYQWRDEYLTWKPESYDNVTHIRLEPRQVWIPDIELYNTADVDVPSRHALAVVTADGFVNWYPHCIFRSACSVDVSNFPFDRQKCNLAFGSWTHTSREVDLNMAFAGGIDLSTFQADHKESSSWDVLNITAARQLMPNEEPSFAVLTFELHLRRKLVFSSYILTLPCIFLASLTLVVFWLPPERPDRTALAMSTFSSFMVLLLILVEAAPPTANTIPKLGVYYCFNMVIIVMTIVLSSMIINLSRGPKDGKGRLPKWIRVITFGCLARALCIWHIRSHISLRADANEHAQLWVTEAGVKRSTKCACSNETSIHRLEQNMHVIQRSLTRIEEKCCSSSKTRESSDDTTFYMWEWKSAALVLDRFFFLFYLILIALSLVFFFPRPEFVSL